MKLGLIANSAQIKIIQQFLAEFKKLRPEVPVILDPVGIAGNGATLALDDTNKAFELLYPLVSLITPNIPEAETLSGEKISEQDLPSWNISEKRIAEYFKSKGVQAVYLKGGHLSTSSELALLKNSFVNCLYCDDNTDPVYFVISRNNFPDGEAQRVHGTGCAFASAVASLIASGYNLKDAITASEVYLAQAVTNSFELWPGMRELSHSHSFYKPEFLPRVFTTFNSLKNFSAEEQGFQKCIFEPEFYTVLDSSDWVLRCLKAGVKTLQLRIKKWNSEAELRSEIQKAVAYGKEYQAQVFIDDHWQLAIEEGAYGVHLGQEDLEIADLKAIKKAGLRLGVSTHGFFEIARVFYLKPSYIAFGHIFPTQSKKMPSLPQGVRRLQNYVSVVAGKIPSVAIGGIKLDKASEILKTGVNSIAVITAVTKAPDPEKAIQEWLLKFRDRRKEK